MPKKKSNKTKKNKPKNNQEHDNIKRLYRSKKDKIVAGVAGGIAEYFMIDPIWIRLVFILLLIADGAGLIIYLIAWILIPENPKQSKIKETDVEKAFSKISKRKKDNSFIFGVIIVIVGAALLMQNLFSWFTPEVFGPLMIIILGIYLINRRK